MVPVSTPEHWTAFHSIRRSVLFESRGRFGVYDENHPDDRTPDNHPFLLLADGSAVAAIRVDLIPQTQSAAFRRLAVAQPLHRRGYGRALLQRAEAFAAEHGRTFFFANVAPDAVAFWEKLGYRLAESQDTAAPNPRMVKQRHQDSHPYHRS
jgi:GNAT superfamily N-acetyltransferase